jgi:hypothetical protein
MATVDPQNQAEVNKLYERYIDLLQKADDLSFAQIQKKAAAARETGTLTKEIDRLNRELQDTVSYTDSIAKGFADTLAELKGQNAQLNVGKSAFRNLSNIASDLHYFQKGISDQTEKQFKTQQEKVLKGREELISVRSRLGSLNEETGEYTYQNQKLLDRLDNQDKLTSSQKKLKEELEKEKALLEAANDAIEEGIPMLQRELDISKKIYDVRESLGGMAAAAAGVVSKYGGSLSQFLKVDDAIESVKKYNQNLIDGALKSKETIAEIRKIEEQRFAAINDSADAQRNIGNELLDIENQINEAKQAGAQIDALRNRLAQEQSEFEQTTNLDERGAISRKILATEGEINALKLKQNNLSNLENQYLQKQNERLQVQKKEKQDLAKLDKDEAKVKLAAIESVNTLTNKFKSLGVLFKSLGAGFIKALTDPLTILTFIIDRALTANAQVVELGKSFGISAKAAEDIRQDVTSFARATGDTFVNTERLLKAQSELSKELGIAVKFSNEELETFAKLTELTGLSSQSAAKLARAAATTGTPTKAYANELRKAAFYAQQSTNTHFSSREILEDIGKLSSGILIKFQGNPKALATAVVEAKKLGLTLDQIDKVGESLLNWESSIENELKAELLTGRELNMERARAAALSGDQLTLTREIADQVGSLEDYQNMNVLAQRSLAEAFGLSREEMAEMLIQQEAINRYGDKAAQLNKEQIEDMERQGLTLDEYLEKQEQQRTAQQKFQDAIVKLQDIIGSLFDGPVGQLIDAFADLLTTAVNILSIFSPIFDVISGIAEFISDIASSTAGKWVFGLTAAAFLIPKLAGGFVGIFNSIGGIGKGLAEAFSPKGFSSFFEGLFSGFKETESLAGKVASTAQETATESVTGSLTEKVTEKGQEFVGEKVESIVGGDDLAGKAEEVVVGGEEISGDDDGENLKKKLQNIAEGLKSFANKDVLLGALNLIPTAIGFTAMIPGAIGAKLVSLIDGEKLKKALEGMATGLKAFGETSVWKGTGNLILASVGLTAMIPGAIGAKLISLVDGDKFEKSMQGMANGITSFGNNNLFKGAFNLILASVGLTAMIPGAIGAKLISLVDGEKFEESMYGIAYGIESFASKKVAVGSLSMILAAVGLTAMIPGAIGAKLISLVDGEKFNTSMVNIANGISSFGEAKIAVGSFTMVMAAVGLTAMIPGAIGAKLISLVDGEKFKTSMEGIANGISSFASGKVAAGSLLMIPAAVALTLMIPGAVGAKLISLVDGEKFEESMYGIAYGIEAFASGKVLGGSIALALAGIALTAMLPGALAAKLISLVDGEKFENSMVGIAKGIEGFFKNISYGTILKAAAALALLGASLIPAAYALNMFGEVEWSSVAKGFVTLGGLALLGYAIGKASDSMLKGAFAIAVLGTSLIPAAYALQMFAEVEWESLAKAGVALVGLGAAGAILGSMSNQMLKGALAIAALGASLIPAAYALQMFADISWEDMAKAGVALAGLGVAGAVLGSFMPLMLMGAIAISALGASLIPFAFALNIMSAGLPALSQLFDSLQKVDVDKLLLVGPALIGVGAGLAALGAGGVIEAIGSFFAGDPAEKIAAIAASGEGLQQTSTALQTTSTAIAQLNSSLASLDVSKLFFIGPALMMIGEGLKSLNGGGVGDVLSSLLAGDPIEKLERLAAIGDRLKDLPSVFQTVVSSITQLNTSLSSLDVSKLDAIGPAITKIGIGLASLGVGNAIDSISSLFAGDPIEKLERLAATSDGLQTASSALQSIAIALMGVSAALTTIDISKLESLSEFEPNKSSKSIFGGITDFFSSPAKTTNETDFTSTPIKTTNETIEGGKEKGTEAPTINASGIDLTPMVNAINEVKAAVTNLQNRPVKLYMDSREITARQLQANNSI